MRIGLLSDTHGFLDPAIFDYFAECDEVWHAGDFGPFEILEQLEKFKPLRGVWGNIDGDKVRAALPEDLQWECEGLRVYMTHIGNAHHVRSEIARFHPGLFICGHSHILKITREPETTFDPYESWSSGPSWLAQRADDLAVHCGRWQGESVRGNSVRAAGES